MFRKPPSKSEPTERGEIPTESAAIMPWYKQPSILANARTVEELGGQRPPVHNLRDHPEMDGAKYTIVGYEFHAATIEDSETGEFVILAGFVMSKDNKPEPVALMTGAADVIARIYQFRDVIDSGTPVTGTFRKAGRAWFFD